ncbi:MAG TPA: hypothetical protein VJT31_03820, partial [Rugosimonospora sp.]|nr:hypothetical protein [Rugosimonospora sp.]
GEVADPLVTFAGAVPLVAASAWRVLYGAEPGVPWRRRLAGTDAALLAAAPVSVLLSWAFLRIVTALGGFHVNPAATQFSPVALWHDRAQLLGRLIAMAYGGYLPEKSGVLPTALGLVHLAALPVVLAAICVVCYRAARRRADRVSLILAVAVVTVTAAYWVSAVDMNLGSAREVIAILPLGAALCGRVWGPRLRRPRHAAPLVAALLAACVAVAVQAGSQAGPVGYIENRGQAEWLVAHGYRFGLATYWCGNSISLASGGRVTAAAVLLDGGVHPYHWESRRDWYLPSRHDARFLAVDLRTADPAEVAALRRQFGPPAASHLVGRYGLLLLYDHNILTQLVPG